VLACLLGRGLARSNDQIGQSEERVELMALFGQSPIAHFPMHEFHFGKRPGRGSSQSASDLKISFLEIRPAALPYHEAGRQN
jgi:hypothetical protein